MHFRRRTWPRRIPGPVTTQNTEWTCRAISGNRTRVLTSFQVQDFCESAGEFHTRAHSLTGANTAKPEKFPDPLRDGRTFRSISRRRLACKSAASDATHWRIFFDGEASSSGQRPAGKSAISDVTYGECFSLAKRSALQQCSHPQAGQKDHAGITQELLTSPTRMPVTVAEAGSVMAAKLSSSR